MGHRAADQDSATTHRATVIAMHFERLVEAASLLRSLWQNAAVLCLARHGPLRYAELAHALVDYAGRPPSEGNLPRVLDRLSKHGLVTADDEHRDHKVYALTQAGQTRARVLITIGEALGGIDDEPG